MTFIRLPCIPKLEFDFSVRGRPRRYMRESPTRYTVSFYFPSHFNHLPASEKHRSTCLHPHPAFVHTRKQNSESRWEFYTFFLLPTIPTCFPSWKIGRDPATRYRRIFDIPVCHTHFSWLSIPSCPCIGQRRNPWAGCSLVCLPYLAYPSAQPAAPCKADRISGGGEGFFWLVGSRPDYYPHTPSSRCGYRPLASFITPGHVHHPLRSTIESHIVARLNCITQNYKHLHPVLIQHFHIRGPVFFW